MLDRQTYKVSYITLRQEVCGWSCDKMLETLAPEELKTKSDIQMHENVHVQFRMGPPSLNGIRVWHKRLLNLVCTESENKSDMHM
jgi:hypothetical protein